MQLVAPDTAGTLTIDQARDNVFLVAMTRNITAVVFAQAAGRAGQRIELHLVQDNVGGRTISGWPASVKLAPIPLQLSTLAGRRDVLTLRQVTNATDPGGVLYAEIARTVGANTGGGSSGPVSYNDLLDKPTIPDSFDDLTGTVPASALPALAINETFTVADQAAMLALTAQRGDIAIRQDLITAKQPAVFILAADAPSTLASWVSLPVPADAVASVAGRTGAVVLDKSDVGLANVTNTADADKPVSTAQAAAINARLAKAANLTDVADPTAARAALAATRLVVDGAYAAEFVVDTTPLTKTDVGLGNVTNDPQVPNNEPGALVTSPDGTSKSGLWTVQQRLPPMRPPTRVVSRFAAGHGWTGGTDDTTVKLFTDRSYRGTTSGTGTSLYLSSPTFGTAQDWTSYSIRIIVRVDDPTKVNLFQVNVTHGAGNNVNAGVQSNLIAGEWAIFTLSRSQFATTAGTANWANVTALNLFLRDKSAGAFNFYVAAVELIPDLASTYPAGVMVLEADDGYANQLAQLAPVVAQRGIPVTYNIITARFLTGTPPSGLTPADLRRLQDKYGWQVSCHAYNQTVHDATPAAAATLEQDFQRQKHWLRANGLHSGVDHLALCPGTGSPVPEGDTLDAIRRSFRSARVNSGNYETAIAADPLRIRSLLYSGQTNAQLQTNITACAGAGGAYVLALHDVIAGSTNGTSNGLPAIAATNLATILDFAATAGMVFRTRGDWLEGR